MLYNETRKNISIKSEQKRSKYESIESIKYFTYWTTIKRVFNNIQKYFYNGHYHIYDTTDKEYSYVLGSGLTVDQAIEAAYSNAEVVRRLNSLNNKK